MGLPMVYSTPKVRTVWLWGSASQQDATSSKWVKLIQPNYMRKILWIEEIRLSPVDGKDPIVYRVEIPSRLGGAGFHTHPQYFIIHFNGIFHDKPTILWYPHWWNPPLIFPLSNHPQYVLSNPLWVTSFLGAIDAAWCGKKNIFVVHELGRRCPYRRFPEICLPQ